MLSSVFSGLSLNENKKLNQTGFILRLCLDDLLEVLRYGDRRWLSKFERVGYRFQSITENFFVEAPFLRLNLELRLGLLFVFQIFT